ncbi:MAG: hypothetical protein HUK20_03690 [Fibrobacter sp.]|nr:hypothetical protein [Fibrobacter sp.]
MLNVELLTSKEVQRFILLAISKKMDALQVSSMLAKSYSNEERVAIMNYLSIVPKICDKFFNAPAAQLTSNINNPVEAPVPFFLMCDKLALEQSTARDIGAYKSCLWPKEGSVHDLCCGMGGDSFFIPETLAVTGVDLDENRLAMYRHNMSLFKRPVSTLLEDACVVGGRIVADYFTIDPARREAECDNQRDLRNLTPTFQEVLTLSKNYRGGMAKLPPAYPTDEIPEDCELVYLGSRTDCRECLVLFGELAKNPGKVRAVMVEKGGGVLAEWLGPLSLVRVSVNKDAEKDLPGAERSYRNATSAQDLPLGEIATYLSEPTALLIRSHLFGFVAKSASPDAHLLSEGIAYVFSDCPLTSCGFASFEIMDHSEITTAAVRAMLKKHDVGKITLKLRGVKLDPETEIKRLKSKGKNSAILFYTRRAGEKIAILAKCV